MMKKLRKHIPLVIFTLMLPGIVLSYPLAVKGGFMPLAMLLVLGGASLGLASLHLRTPAAAPLIMDHFARSWFSREAVFFACFFPGLAVQSLFSELRMPLFTGIILTIGLAGMISTIMIYWQSPHLRKWRILVDFGGDALFVASLLILILHDWVLLVESPLYQIILLALGGKVIKDVLVSGVELWHKREELLWVMTGTLALLGGALLLGEVLQQSGHFFWGIFLILGMNAVTMRLQLIDQIEEPSLAIGLVEARKEYMPSKYRKYF